MKPKRIAVITFNASRRDPRVRRISGSLVRAGHEVFVIERRRPDEPATERYDGFEVRRVDPPASRSRKEMAEVERESPELAALLRGIEPGLFDHKIAEHPWPVSIADRARWRIQRRLLRARTALEERILFNPDRPKTVIREDEILRIRSVLLSNLDFHRAALEVEPDIIHSNDLDTLIGALMTKRARSIPLVFDAHEIYAEQWPRHLRSRLWHEVYHALERDLLPRTDGRITVCESIARYFDAELRAPGFRTIRNVPSLRFLPTESVLARKNRPRRILYHGLYAPFRGLEQVISAAKELPRGSAEIVLRGIGDHERVLRARVESEGVTDRVRFVAPVAVDQLIATASDNDVGLNPFIAVSLNTEYALPNKFFEYMMAGLAVASSDLVEMRTLTEKLDIGALFRSTEPSSIALELLSLLADEARLDACRERAFYAARNEYHWENEERRLLEYYRTFTG
jgi:glycosyltransferase involved in cell wall biosynthesis